MRDISTEDSIIINAPIERVWKALTTPELIKQWFFGVDSESNLASEEARSTSEQSWRMVLGNLKKLLEG
jgi:uncharacterized protein YndB with AHSA1/START domain